MTIGKKLIVSFAAILGCALLLVIAAITTNISLQREVDRTANGTARKQYLAGQIGSATAEMAAAERAIVLSTMLQQADRTAEAKRQFRSAATRLDEAVKQFDGAAETSSIAAKSSEVQREHAE